MSERRAKAGMKFDCIFENTLDFIDIDYIHLNKVVRYENRPHGEWVKKVINGMPCIVCSNCLSPRHPEVGYDWYNIYCGHCGSRNN